MVKSNIAFPVGHNTSMFKMNPHSDNLMNERFRALNCDVLAGGHGMNPVYLDEWLAGDLQQPSFLSGNEDSLVTNQKVVQPNDVCLFPPSPPLSSGSTHSSPLLGFENAAADYSLLQSPLFDTTSPQYSPTSSPPQLASSLGKNQAIDLYPDISAVGSAFLIPWAADNAGAPAPVPRPTTNAQIPSPPLSLPVDLTRSAPKPRGVKRASLPTEGEIPDEVMLKRQKNTDAARRSRLKKVMKMESLEKRVTEAESENSKLVLRVAVLESEKSSWESKENDYEKRIKKLEAQLLEAHKLLTSRLIPTGTS